MSTKKNDRPNRAKLETTPERSRIMSSIRCSRTKPELMAKPFFDCLGFEYQAKVDGVSVDFVHRGMMVAVFIDGCFWHGCERHFKAPIHNGDWWRSKIEANVARDGRNRSMLADNGWTVVRIWEHDMKRRAPIKMPSR